MIDRPAWTDGLADHPSLLHRVQGLVLGQELRDAVLRHLTAALPHEGVGLLATAWMSDELGVGSRESGVERNTPDSRLPPGQAPDSFIRAMKFYPGRNVDASPSRFTMDPVEVLHALREIDEHGWWLGAIVHSHPHGPGRPSATDLREARYPDALTVIVSLAEQPARLRAWRLPVSTTQPGAIASTIEVPVWVRGAPPALGA